MQQEASLPQKFTRDYPTLCCSNATRSNGGANDSASFVRFLQLEHARGSIICIPSSISLRKEKETKQKSERWNRASQPTVASSSTTITAIEDEFIMSDKTLSGWPRGPRRRGILPKGGCIAMIPRDRDPLQQREREREGESLSTRKARCEPCMQDQIHTNAITTEKPRQMRPRCAVAWRALARRPRLTDRAHFSSVHAARDPIAY